MLTFISLFAGIGGLDLGLERSSMQCVAQVEIDPYAQQVLAKHWPTIPRFADVRTVGSHNLPQADIVAGGFPCQDISFAGEGAGIDGARSGLWSEFHRIICELQPRYVLVENVAALLHRGLGRVLGDLAGSGYDAEWSLLSACAVGAPFTRERLFIVAYRSGIGGRRRRVWPDGGTGATGPEAQEWTQHAVTHTRSYPVSPWWSNEPGVGRVAYGLSSRMDRLKGIGNCVVPQVAELVGRLIVAHAQEATA